MPAIDHYVVVLRDAGDTTTVATQTVDADTLEATFTGLEPGTTYTVKIYSKAGAALSANPLVLTVATTFDPSPGEPLNVADSALSSTTAAIGWDLPSHLGNPPLDQYVWTLLKGSDFSTVTSGTVSAPTRTVNITGLASGTEYLFNVYSKSTVSGLQSALGSVWFTTA